MGLIDEPSDAFRVSTVNHARKIAIALDRGVALSVALSDGTATELDEPVGDVTMQTIRAGVLDDGHAVVDPAASRFAAVEQARSRDDLGRLRTARRADLLSCSHGRRRCLPLDADGFSRIRWARSTSHLDGSGSTPAAPQRNRCDLLVLPLVRWLSGGPSWIELADSGLAMVIATDLVVLIGGGFGPSCDENAGVSGAGIAHERFCG